jgi:YggT family protein
VIIKGLVAAPALIANEALSQLSYGPIGGRAEYVGRGRKLSRPAGTSLADAARAGLGFRPHSALPLRSPSHANSPNMLPLIKLIDIVITFYMWVVIIYVVVSWLVAFDVINTRNNFVRTVGDTLYRLTEPALRPIRRVMPNLGGVDLSPMVLILLLWFVRELMYYYLVPAVV